jgi:hypothetical protein
MRLLHRAAKTNARFDARISCRVGADCVVAGGGALGAGDSEDGGYDETDGV